MWRRAVRRDQVKCTAHSMEHHWQRWRSTRPRLYRKRPCKTFTYAAHILLAAHRTSTVYSICNATSLFLSLEMGNKKAIVARSAWIEWFAPTKIIWRRHIAIIHTVGMDFICSAMTFRLLVFFFIIIIISDAAVAVNLCTRNLHFVCRIFCKWKKQIKQKHKKYDGRLQEIFAELFANAAVCPPNELI